MKIVSQKQNFNASAIHPSITLDELFAMQKEVRAVNILCNINELADNILCELRRKEMPVPIIYSCGAGAGVVKWLRHRFAGGYADSRQLSVG